MGVGISTNYHSSSVITRSTSAPARKRYFLLVVSTRDFLFTRGQPTTTSLENKKEREKNRPKPPKAIITSTPPLEPKKKRYTYILATGDGFVYNPPPGAKNIYVGINPLLPPCFPPFPKYRYVHEGQLINQSIAQQAI